ncbi:phd finger protein 20-related [Holotrichia oblita]|uniref:Phd finger protein 20-related n=1 Tax=Holotrichia oblita TaxID=644536 RepID=A0ACB9THV0_HOLOL|nr:phd finger protein 20-related [Holotrichia oblita]
MGRKCGISVCMSDSNREEDRGVTFHKIPMHPDIRPKWMSLCRIPEDKKFMKAKCCLVYSLGIKLKSKLKQKIKGEIEECDKNDGSNEDSGSKLEGVPEILPQIKFEVTEQDFNESTSLALKSEEGILDMASLKEEVLKQQIDPLTFAPNTRIEALDFNQAWCPAQIVEVDYQENEVLVHFEKYSNKYDEWICMNSSTLRALPTNASNTSGTSKKIETYEIDTYEVHFDDGYVKVLKAHRMSKATGKSLQASPLFDPVREYETGETRTPDGRKFRTRTELKAYIEEKPELNLTESMFDFSIYKKSRKSMPERKQHQPVTEPPVPRENSPCESPIDEEIVTELSNCLKIPVVDNAYKCPIEGCGKNFRRENLAQMHVKHYHPEYTKFLDSTPNVADLAYARTVGESLDRSPGQDKPRTPALKPIQKILNPKMGVPRSTQSPSFEIEQQQHAVKIRDSEIIKLLSSKPTDGIKKEEQRSQSPILPPGLPPSMYPDIKLKDLLIKSEAIPKRDDINLKTLSASTQRPTGIKTLLPVTRVEPKLEEIEPGLNKNFGGNMPLNVNETVRKTWKYRLNLIKSKLTLLLKRNLLHRNNRTTL